MFALNASRLRSKRLEIAGMSDWNSRRVWWCRVESNMMEEPEKGLPRTGSGPRLSHVNIVDH
jgi:hypothetical protein